MDKFWWHAAWGLCLVPLSLAQIDLNITCRFAGVFHVEKNGRYSISRTEAADLCKAFNSTLPTMAQMEKALSIGFETCSLHCSQQSKKVWAEEKASDQQWQWSCGGQKAKWTQWRGQQVSGNGAFGEQGVIRNSGPVYDS
ncbi:CD44 antigen isoform X24 [Pongo pygmaeus]|uniref:CD44 isoform 11 n=1 Tax=Pongo abelii TaxID=9601 RepID=A0A2J8WFY9_PONAB|nr:CD44 antigen isoform X22 [Pongo abelii]XP_054294247.1 CD44 antigen isoform X19 [Pongo pygmaeus]PNJ68664.1 CD44 isoform 11 [Pongo abelii]